MPWTSADMPSQRDRTAVVTGTGGLGFETALALARKGSDVVLAGRNPRKGILAVDRILAQVPSGTVRFEALDLADLTSVKAFATRMIRRGVPLDILVNNAGIMAVPTRQETADEFELQFGTNYLGHFALTMRLMPLLLMSSGPRVVSVSSLDHRRGHIRFMELQSQRTYRPGVAYSQSKLAILMFAFELERRARAAELPLMSVAAHPGSARTNLIANGPGAAGLTGFIKIFASQSPAEGALPILFAATDPVVHGGDYYGPTGRFELTGPPGDAFVAPQARDTEVARRLWTASEELTRTNHYLLKPQQYAALAAEAAR